METNLHCTHKTQTHIHDYWTVQGEHRKHSIYTLTVSSWKQLEVMALLIRVITAPAHLSYSRFIFV